VILRHLDDDKHTTTFAFPDRRLWLVTGIYLPAGCGHFAEIDNVTQDRRLIT
jgi:hypothetical protein